MSENAHGCQGTFHAYRRASGQAGIRNRLLILPTVICSTQVCNRIAAQVPGAVTLPHQHGCSQAVYDVNFTAEILRGMANNPGVSGAVVVSLGCEGIDGAALTARIGAGGTPAEFVSIQEAGGSLAAIRAGVAAAERLRSRLPEIAPASLSDLVVGIRLGQTDASLAFTGQALCSAALALLQAGGTVVLSGALGGMPEAGRLTYAQRPPGPGLWLMEAPAQHEAEALTGLAAAGAAAILYGTGEGSPIGNPVVPVIKLTASEQAVAHWGDHIDLDLRQEPAPAQAILRLLREVSGGRETAAEILGHEEFAIHRIGLAL